MIELRDSVEINAPPEAVWAWLEAMPEHYLEWHPDHVSCRWVSGDALALGAVMAAEERLHGQLHRLRLTLTEVEPGRRFAYRVQRGMSGEFELASSAGGTRFTATLRLGLEGPLLGPVVDALLGLAMRRRLDSFRQHQREEGLNLKALLEADAS